MDPMFRAVRVIPVVTIEREADAAPLARALARGGLGLIEVTLRTPAAPAAIAAIAREVPEAIVGAGTVLRDADVGRARAAGARFLVSPGLTPELASAGLASGVPYVPGVMTPSEVILARDLGFSFLKFYPAAGAGGIATLRNYALVFAGMAFCPTGGVTGENAGEYLALPNVPVVGGAWMVSAAALAAGDWASITEAARRASALG
ncbi:MAG: bifunctional 4-hydroxy-2-oxoglutarate aldolase/2-dehydro-3-deoxy-phosphogluconate aldolase [Alphaproteobacteria bacterium]|nr:bifunctional 4-hydroxy-2-oxoglutarate aldolase/2-dehydro-3-deoxy-phosphogluconate aldolase [Alphaproteobacteria bacterium]